MKNKIKLHHTKYLPILFLLAAPTICTSCFPTKQKKEHLLIFTGGHPFERKAFFKIFDDMPNVEYREAAHPNANHLYASSLIDSIDVLVFYDMVQEINDTEKADFIALLNKGKGIVFLHHSLVNYQEWDEYENIIGGHYYLSFKNRDSSTYKHDVDIPVKILDKKHPVTKGIEDFIIHDEVYGNFKVLPIVHPLLSTTHPESGEIIGWTNKYGKSRIVYIQLGHDRRAYENPNYRRLVKQAIDWVQKK